MLKGTAKTELLAATAVPLPKRRFGPRKQRKESMLQKTAQHASKYWMKSTPTFCIPNVKVEELAQRSKPSKSDKAQAAQVMEEMTDWESHAFSAKFADADGNLLAAYFSNRIITPDKAPNATYIGGPQTPSQHGCSVADLRTAQNDVSVKLAFDGLPVSMLCDFRLCTDKMHSLILWRMLCTPPKFSTTFFVPTKAKPMGGMTLQTSSCAMTVKGQGK